MKLFQGLLKIPAATAMIVVIVVVALITFVVPRWLAPLPPGELQMAMVVVFAISVLLFMLYVTAVGFSTYGMANAQQALGLPEGSIRALIALFLIMIFIIMSIYLFRNVANQRSVTITGLSTEQITKLENQSLSLKKTGDDQFDVTVNSGISASGEQLALQLATVLGTLVTAVSAFYFGSATVTSAQRNVSDLLSLQSIDPFSVQQSALSTPILLTLTGTGFASPIRVLLRQVGHSDIEATGVQVDAPTIIKCTVNLQGQSVGKWSVWVLSSGGSAVFKNDLLEIIP